MSFEAVRWVMDHVMNIKPAHKLVLLCVANYASVAGKGSYPSVKTISRHAEMSERSVQRILHDLVEAKLLRIGNQAIPQAAGLPADRCPTCYDLPIDEMADCFELVRQKIIPQSGKTGVTKTETGVTNYADRGDKSGKTGVTTLSPKPITIKPLYKPTTNTHAQAQETKSEAKPEPAATDGWLAFGHEVMAAAGVDYTRSMHNAGCVRQWLADAAKAGYTRQQAEAVILDVVRERAKYGGQGKPPAWFSRPVADAIANGSVGASQEAQECGQAEWEGEWRTDYLRHVQSRSNGAGAVMSRDAFRAEWMKEKGIEA